MYFNVAKSLPGSANVHPAYISIYVSIMSQHKQNELPCSKDRSREISALFPQSALGFGFRREGLFTWNSLRHFVVIPRLF